MTQQTNLPDDQRYGVENSKEIAQILSELAKQKTTLKAAFNQGNDSCLTTVIEVDDKNHAVYLDIGMDEAFNKKLLASHHVVFSKDDGIKIRWTSTSLTAVNMKDGRAIKIALPHHLVRLQRREYFRLGTPLTKPVMCKLPTPDPENPEEDRILEVALLDASLGGIAIIVADPLDPALEVGASFYGCKIDFPEVGMTSLTTRVIYSKRMTQRDGGVKHRLGLAYIEPSRGNQGLIQRFQFNLEREAAIVASKV